MTRKPVNEITKSRTRAAIWEVIRAFGKQEKLFTSREVRMQTWCSKCQVDEYMRGLVAAGILVLERDIKKENLLPGTAHLYRLAKDEGREAPRVRRDGSRVLQGLGREQMWRTMRVLKTFTAVDLATMASIETVPVKVSSAADYCHFLALAGYLKVVKKGKGKGCGGEASLYRFLPSQRKGPLPPMIQRTKSVFDPNINEVVWSEENNHGTE